MAHSRSMTRRLGTLIWVIGLGTVYSLYLRDWLSPDLVQQQLGLPAPELDQLVQSVLNKPLDSFIQKALG